MKSMTGYGRGKFENDGRSYTFEIKSVNHKYSEISVRLPRNLIFLEDKIRKTVLNQISRGKIDIQVTFDNMSSIGKNIKINQELALMYLKEAKELATKANLDPKIDIIDILKLPDVMVTEEADNEELLWDEAKIALNNAIDKFISMRRAEGEIISSDLKSRIELIAKKTDEISVLSTGLAEEYVVKLEERIKELLKTDVIDQTRLAQEVVIYSDKCSIQEEITRLKSHTSQFIELIQKDEPVGKNLDFLVQEMNRETNTIGSKANKLEITNIVVELKTIIEDIREQIQNIE